MDRFLGTKEEARLAELVREAERAKLEKTKDRYGLPPVEKGFMRGRALNIRQTEQPCEYGVLQILEFELCETMTGPGVPVRMNGTHFSRRLVEGSLVDVPDPSPDVRPITPTIVYPAYNRLNDELRAFYPGRGETPPRTSMLLGLLGMGVPVAVAIAALIALRLFHFL